jgi:NADH-quinone oxidoreductase subunit J
LDSPIQPLLFYLLVALGGVGVWLALPRKGLNPQVIGAVLAAAAGGLVILLLSIAARDHLPSIYFYIFSAVALGAGLRVITHPRPVYAALYFILTVLATAGLFVILAAEFLAFALVIVYAGAILITYLFVIMLATQAPTQEQADVQADYDTQAREPLAATLVGFLLLGVLSTMLFRGVGELPPPAGGGGDAGVLALLPGKAPGDDATNVEGVAVSLLRDHPGSIEIAGVILLMAMLGAVVLARKQVQLDEEAKARHAAQLSDQSGGAA